ncbi:MAG: SCO family protein [Balneolaceae bacterium]
MTEFAYRTRKIGSAVLAVLLSLLAGSELYGQSPESDNKQANTNEKMEIHSHHHHNQSGMSVAEPLDDRSVYQLGREWTDHRGESIQLDQFLGNPVILVMFYGSCREVCPILIQDSWRLYREVDERVRESVSVVAVTFDTEKDTPDVLMEYAEKERLNLSNWYFVTSTPRAVRELATVLGVQYRKRSDGMYDHSNLVAVLDKQGVVAARIEGLGRPVEKAAGEIEQMVQREESR